MAEDDARVLFAEIARDLASQHSEQAVLQRVVEWAVRVVEGCENAGIMLLHRKHQVETAAVTGQLVRDSDEAQNRLAEGPCFDAALDSEAWSNRIYRSDDLATETRWPSYVPRARELGIGSMMGFQLYAEEDVFGALDLYSSRRLGTGPQAEQTGWVLASHAAVALTSARNNEQLHTALETRALIGQALGRVMERYDLSEETAFAVLKRSSQHSNVKLREIAETVVRTGHIPGTNQPPPAE